MDELTAGSTAPIATGDHLGTGGDVLYPNIMRTVFGSCWAIQEDTLAIITDVLLMRARGERFTAEEIDARLAAAVQRSGPRNGPRSGLVAVVPVYGTISARAGMMSRSSGGTSVEEITGMLRDAHANADVNSIILDIDSPGGTVDGVYELANEIRAMRQSNGGEKPIVAMANTMAASAAYLIASAADEIVVAPSGQVGSIGVLLPHIDRSVSEQTQGIKTTLISAGKYKTEGNPFEPLTDEARAEMQGKVDEYYAMMKRDIAAGRGITTDAVSTGYGQGRMLLARPALKAGMVDRVDTLDNTVRRLARGGAVKSKGQAMPDFEALANGEVQAQTGTGREAFADRLGLAAEEVGVVAQHARDRAAMRAAEGRKLSDADRDGLRALLGTRASLEDVEALLSEQEAEPAAVDPATGDTANGRNVKVTLMMADARRRGYPPK